eukprot:1150263-Pelagomonas_calceolata.AAC.2
MALQIFKVLIPSRLMLWRVHTYIDDLLCEWKGKPKHLAGVKRSRTSTPDCCALWTRASIVHGLLCSSTGQGCLGGLPQVQNARTACIARPACRMPTAIIMQNIRSNDPYWSAIPTRGPPGGAWCYLELLGDP